MTPLANAIALIQSRVPANIGHSVDVVDKETGAVSRFGFDDDHEFLISIPKWALDAISGKDANRAANK